MEEKKLVMFSCPLGFEPGTCQSQWESTPLLLKQKTPLSLGPAEAYNSYQMTEPSQKQ